MSEEKAESSFAELERLADEYAKAQAEADHLAEFRKSKKALLMQEAERLGKTSAVMQEREAYAHPEYIALLDGLNEATERALALKWKLRTWEMRLDVWRTKQATARAEMNLR